GAHGAVRADHRLERHAVGGARHRAHQAAVHAARAIGGADRLAEAVEATVGSAEPSQSGEDLSLTLAAALAARPRDVIDVVGLRRAAVLVPLLRRDGAWRLLFTERGAGLRAHGGQVSFPGGAVDRDETFEDTAVREAEEEVGIDPAHVRVLG